ncbi:MAG: hypothetical protein ACOX4G_09935 [Limnochordia bacterium]
MSDLVESDRHILRELATRYLEICYGPSQTEKRRLWRQLHSLRPTQPLIYVRAFAWSEMPESKCGCTDPFLRQFEAFFRQSLFRHSLDDDFIFEPWVSVPAVYRCTGWGVEGTRQHSTEARGSWKMQYPLHSYEDLSKLRPPWHEIDEEKTAARVARLQDLIGDILTINAERGPAYRMWAGDISTHLGYLRGIEHFMLDMYDNPEGLHKLCSFLGAGVLRTHDQAEAAGDWDLSCHQNQAMPYAEELPDPTANVRGVSRKQLWCFMAAQEFATVSPQMHEEFLLRYQLPILEQFGLTAYGCCEDLTRKISMLRQIPNLRRIAVAPSANVASCVEQIGTDYVISYRPSPVDMVGYGWDEPRVRRILKEDLDVLQGCLFDITLKDVETVQYDPARVRRWVQVVRELTGTA